MAGTMNSPNVAISDPEKTDPDEPRLSITFVIMAIIATTALIASNSQFEKSVPPTFVGLVILSLPSLQPWRYQVALLVVLFTVLLGWCIRVESMSLEFDAFPTVSLFIAMILLGYVVQEGKSNWLTGALLIKIWVIISMASGWLP